MAKLKGSEKVGGRVKGTPNKTTLNAREAIASFVEGNVDRLNNWLDLIAAKDPKEAFSCFMSVVEYHVPKLQRQEVSGLNGKPIEIKDITYNDKSIINQYIKEKINELQK